jgi:hypothetical protein
VPAISTGDQQGVTDITNSIPNNRQGNYTGTGATPSIVDEGSDAGGNGLLANWSNPSELNLLVQEMQNVANYTFNCGYANAALGQNGPGQPCSPTAASLGTAQSPVITVVNGDFNMGPNTGYGVLVVTGTLNITGNSGWNGLVLVIGQGFMTEQGGGHGQFNGSIFLANSNSHTAPYGALNTLGTPTLQWNGGGTNGIQYNSCWANVANQLHYMVVASREEMY